MKKIFLLLTLIIISICLYADDSDFIIDSNNELINYSGSNNYVLIPDGVEIISSSAFENSPQITDIYLPETFKNYAFGAFICIPNLKNIYVNKYNSEFSSKDGILYCKTYGEGDKEGEILEHKSICLYPRNKQGKVFYIPDNIYSIISCCFANNEYLESIYSDNDLFEIGIGSFNNCKNLKNVTLGLGAFSTIPEYCFSNCINLKKIQLNPNYSMKIACVKNYAFSNCPKLTYIDFNIISEIGEKAFYNCGIKSINIDNETEIHKNAFYKSNIYKINIDKYNVFTSNYLTVEDVKKKFINIKCDTLKEIYFRGKDGKQHLYSFKTKKKVY